jgi:ElaB/YqjD/DUF883 family membrane-anchored ribosome-binding protein
MKAQAFLNSTRQAEPSRFMDPTLFPANFPPVITAPAEPQVPAPTQTATVPTAHAVTGSNGNGAAAGSAEDLQKIADHALEDARRKWDALWKEGEKYIRDNPGKAVLAALGVGVIVGMIFKN